MRARKTKRQSLSNSLSRPGGLRRGRATGILLNANQALWPSILRACLPLPKEHVLLFRLLFEGSRERFAEGQYDWHSDAYGACVARMGAHTDALTSVPREYWALDVHRHQ